MTPAELAALQKANALLGHWRGGVNPCRCYRCQDVAAAIEQARQEEREAYAAIFDYAVNSQAAHHSEVCDCGLCRAIAAIRARAQEQP